MMRSKIERAVLTASRVLISLAPGFAHSFDVHTHAEMTSKAWTASAASTPTFQQHLGLLDYPGTIGKTYFDLASSIVVRDDFRFEQQVSDHLLIADPLPDLNTLEGWIVRGAIREDDNSKEVPYSDEPGGVFSRVLAHFYDPYHNKGLDMLGVPAEPRSVDWALDLNANVYDIAAPFTPRANHYGISYARESMWRALTMTTSDGNGGYTAAPSPTGNSMTAEDVRNAYWATAFRALGDAVHLLQDMGQPQHTRNDPHSGYGCALGQCDGGHASFFENYLRARTVLDRQFYLPEGYFQTSQGNPVYVDPDRLVYGGYDAVRLATYAEFFGPGGQATNATGKGLANYSNRGFYSAGTNIGNAIGYPSPPPDGAGLAHVASGGLQDMTKHPLDATVTFLEGPVFDAYTGAATPDVKLSTEGLWDQFLGPKGSAAPTLNHYNYDDQAALLVPRAVGYSAGLVDFFFRGRLQISLPDDGVYSIVDHSIVNTSIPVQGFNKIRMKVKNVTAAVNGIDQNMTGGVLVAVLKYHLNTCYTPDLSGEWGSVSMKADKGTQVFASPDDGGCRTSQEEIIVSDVKTGQSLAVGEEKQLEFTFSSSVVPINATDIYLQVVYRGQIGSEADDVAVETKDIGEPTFTAYMNGTDYLFCYNGTFYYRGPNGEFPTELQSVIPGGDSQYPPVTLNDVMIAYQPNDAAPASRPLVQITSIPPKSYIRYAVLSDLGVNWGFTANAGTVSEDHNVHPADLTLQANQVYSAYDAASKTLQLTERARDVIHVRQHNAAAGTFFYWSQGTPCTGDYPPDIYNDPPQLLPITINNYPLP